MVFTGTILVAAMVGASAVEMQLQPTQHSGVSFYRQCDMLCESVSDWYDTADSARQACGQHKECVAIVDHSATRGRYGTCLRGAAFSQGSKERHQLAVVCVEYKGVPQPASLLQVGEATVSTGAERDVSSLFERECDMMCDGTAASFGSLDAAQRACAGKSDCVAVVDHSANRGKFGLCGHDSPISRGSDRHKVFTRVCVERKKSV